MAAWHTPCRRKRKARWRWPGTSRTGIIALAGGCVIATPQRAGDPPDAARAGGGDRRAERDNLLDRYDELLSTSLSDSRRLRTLLAKQGRVILALDGLQPDVGHEVLWVVRDCLSGEVLLARSLLSVRPRISCRCCGRWRMRWGTGGGGSATARPRSAARWSGRCLALCTSFATSISCARRRGPSLRPTGMPRRS